MATTRLQFSVDEDNDWVITWTENGKDWKEDFDDGYKNWATLASKWSFAHRSTPGSGLQRQAKRCLWQNVQARQGDLVREDMRRWHAVKDDRWAKNMVSCTTEQFQRLMSDKAFL